MTAADADPWLQVRHLPGQYAFLRDPAQVRLFRGPQQAIGKTWAGAMDLIGHGTGLHPWCPPALLSPTPHRGWVVCTTWEQSFEVQCKIFELLPKRLLHPEDLAKWDDAVGWGVKAPRFRLLHRSGGWSRYRIKTSRQGGSGLTSASLTYAWFDEPPASARVFAEVHKRILKAGKYGRLIATMTPINQNVGWLEREVEEDHRFGISDHHRRLEPSELIPVGQDRPIVLDDGTPCDAEWVAIQRAQTLAHEVPVVCDAEWRMAAQAPIFTAFREDLHVTTAIPKGRTSLYLGLDHGLRIHAQVAILIAVEWPGGRGGDPRVWILDEAIGEGDTTDSQDADAILAMLERSGLRWSSLDAVYGDRKHYGSSRVVQKSNERLTAALERHPRAQSHGIRRHRLDPPIRPAKRGASNQPGSVSYGCTWLHKLMLQPGRLQVHDRADFCIRAFLGYDMAPNSEESHAMDAIRYGLRDLIYSSRRRSGARVQFG